MKVFSHALREKGCGLLPCKTGTILAESAAKRWMSPLTEHAVQADDPTTDLTGVSRFMPVAFANAAAIQFWLQRKRTDKRQQRYRHGHHSRWYYATTTGPPFCHIAPPVPLHSRGTGCRPRCTDGPGGRNGDRLAP